MDIFVVRHGQTVVDREQKEVWESYGAFGPPLSNDAVEKSRNLRKKFIEVGIDVTSEPTATSQYLRTRQTAMFAGFTTINDNALLYEVNTGNPNLSQQLIKLGQVPPEAQKAADLLLQTPPIEKVWFTHGLVIAVLLLVTGQNTALDLEPQYATILKITL